MQIAGNAVGFITVLTAGFRPALLGSDVLHLILARIVVPRRASVTANAGPASLAWLLVIIPAVIDAQNSRKDPSAAHLLAVGQAVAQGPLLGLSQPLMLRQVTSRWAGWTGAIIVSWLVVDAAVYLLPHMFGGLNVCAGSGSSAGVYLTLIATTPLTGWMLLWVLAPSLPVSHRQPEAA